MSIKLGTVSTAADLLQRGRVARDLEAEVARLQAEVTTGRHADLSIAIGARVADAEALRQDLTRAEAFQVSNAQLESRLNLSQSALQTLVDGNIAAVDQLVAARTAPDVRGSTAIYADNRLEEIASILDTRFGSTTLFGGINSDTPPFANGRLAADGAGRVAVRDAFDTEFGFPPGSDLAANITPGDMTAFLDGAFADLFSSANWSALWTAASDTEQTVLVDPRVSVTSGVSATGDPYATMVAATVMVADLGLETLSDGTAELVIDRAMAELAQASDGLVADQGRLAGTQDQLQSATDRLTTRIDVFQMSIAQIEGVDVFERSGTLLDTLTQLDISYELTARLQNLTLLNRI